MGIQRTRMEWIEGKTTPIAVPTSVRHQYSAVVLRPSDGVNSDALLHRRKETLSTRSPPYCAAAQPPGI